MPFPDFWERASLIEEFKAEEWREKMTAAAFIGWQMGAGQKKSFHDYLKSMKLTDPEPQLTPEQKREIAARGYDTAARIAEMDRRERQ